MAMPPAAGYVYVAALSNGTVKVGRSQDAGRRLREHKINARTLGLDVTDSWISPLHLEWLPNEDALKKIATDLGGVPESREVFSNVEFGALAAMASELTFSPPDATAGPDRAAKHAPLPPVPALHGPRIDQEQMEILRAIARFIYGPENRPQRGLKFREESPHRAAAAEALLWFEDAYSKYQAASEAARKARAA